MTQPNQNDTKFEQQRSDAETASLKGQTEDNHSKDTEAAAKRIADNLQNSEDKE